MALTLRIGLGVMVFGRPWTERVHWPTESYHCGRPTGPPELVENHAGEAFGETLALSPDCATWYTK